MNWMAFWVSIQASLTATAIVGVLGISLGYLMAKARFPGRTVLEMICSLPIALPPTVVGYYLLTQLGGPGPVRSASIALFGHPLTFTFAGVVVAQAIESFPYCLRSARAAIEGVDARFEQAARTMGMPEGSVALRVTLPLARRGIVVGIALAFGRALGDFGATVAVSGHLPSTTTMPVALFDAVFDGSAEVARNLALVQITLAVAILLGVGRLGRTRAW